jgi:Fe-S cluster assembly protein SufD
LAETIAPEMAPARPALDETLLAALAAAAGDSGDGLSRRLSARARFEAAEAPSRVRHLWRFTDPARLLPVNVTAGGGVAAGVPHQPAAPVPGAAATIDLWPGLSPVVVLAADLPAGLLTVVPAGDGAGTVALPADELFLALNEAAWNAGVGVKVADGARLPGPIHVRVHASAAASLPRVRLIVGRGAEATLVEQHLGGGPDVRVTGHTAITAGDGARVRHAIVQVWAQGTSGHLSVATRAGADADVLTVFGAFGGDAAKLELRTDLAGKGAHSEIVGVTFVTDRQHGDVHTSHRHLAEHTSSRIEFKAVAAERARSTYTGLIRIEDHAHHCEAYQVNRNLLLSDRARADAIPELEIHNQEVSCSHGATIAPVDPEQLFYLQSRGLEPSAAVSLVVGGFLENTLARLPDDVRAMVEAFVGPRVAAIREGSA